MRFKEIVWIVAFLVLSLVYTWYQSNGDRKVDWTKSYSPEDKIPYGTYILHQGLPRLFPASRMITSDVTLVDALEQVKGDTADLYVFVGRRFQPDQVEMNRLLSWTGQGNHLFIAAEQFADTLLQIFSLKQSSGYRYSYSHLLYAGLDSVKYYFDNSYAACFEPDSIFKGEILGVRDSIPYPDFVRIPCNKGEVYLNLNPAGFTNYNLLDSVQGDYYYNVLSCLPDRGGVILLDAYPTLGKAGRHTLLLVILRYPALQMALYLLLLGGLLYVLFRARREQRPIPVIVPPENRMLEFVATVSELYYKRKEHTAIALKQIDFFLGEVRVRYFLQTDRLDEQFVRVLSERSGVDELQVDKLIKLVKKIKSAGWADEAMLKDLVEGTEKFYS